MKQKNRKLTIVIVILVVLLCLSAAALTGTLLYNHFVRTEPTTVDIPGNIITPDSEISTYTGKDSLLTDSWDSSQTPSNNEAGEFNDSKPSDSNLPSSEMTKASSVSGTKASAISLHNKQPEENKPFQAANMFPGDSETKYYRINVSYKGNIIVRYHADIRPEYEKLAEVLKVKIRLLGSDGFLYDGLMRDMPKSLNYSLYTTKSSQSELYYEITAYLDTSVGNEYMDKELIADFRWWVEETSLLDSPQTGDISNIYLWFALAIGSLFVLIILLAKRRKETADEIE